MLWKGLIGCHSLSCFGNIFDTEKCRKAPFYLVFAPHAWGLLYDFIVVVVAFVLCPTCVGVTPSHVLRYWLRNPLPHMRGGYSFTGFFNFTAACFAPHAWGLLYKKSLRTRRHSLCPTCVGVTLTKQIGIQENSSLPHMRGGYSVMRKLKKYKPTFAPHAWGLLYLSDSLQGLQSLCPTIVGFFDLKCAVTYNIRV